MSTPTRSSYSSAKAPRWLRMGWLGIGPRLYRVLVLAAVAWLVHVGSLGTLPPDEISLADARLFFPMAARLADGDKRLGGQTVVDANSRALGLVLTTSPHTDHVIGYAGPSNLLIALDLKQTVLGVRLLSSGDTQAHVDQVQISAPFWRQFAGRRRDKAVSPIEGVSGSTLTSLAMAEAIERRLGGPITSLRFPEPVTLSEVQSLFPQAAAFEADPTRTGWQRVLDQRSNLLGFAVRTSPSTDSGHGYRGPTEMLIGVAADGKALQGLIIRKSYDTPDYVARVRDDDDFIRLLISLSVDEWATMDFGRAGIEGVSGATQTSFAVADGLKRRFTADRMTDKAARDSWTWSPGLLAVITGGLAMTFTRLRTHRWLRRAWQGVLIALFLFWVGDLLSVALLAGWMRHGIPWSMAPTVVLMVAVALLVPWATRRQIYCQSMCPHGAAQAWLGRFKRLHLPLPVWLHRWQPRLRFAVLVVAVFIAVLWISFDLAWLEPFDGWVLKSAAAVSASLAVVGLVASIFVPQAYCRFGCPTGELLAIIKSGGSHDRLNRRDWIAGGLVLAGALAMAIPRLPFSEYRTLHDSPKDGTKSLSGQAFGTTWSVRIRGPHDTSALQAAVADELERIESSLSHWRPDSFTSQFNASETTLATEQPEELIALVARAQWLSQITDGAYDITVAPLIDAWGFGPSGGRATPPSDAEISELMERTGWQKLIIDASNNTLRKSHPQLQIDLGSLLQGYAADRVAQLLNRADVAEYLVDVGGELFARGSWQVAIEDPLDSRLPLRRFVLADSGLATSGFYRATKQIGGVSIHHLISPNTGRPVEATAALAVVAADSALEADGWATALLAVGLPRAMEISNEQDLAALMLDLKHAQQLSSVGQNAFNSIAPPAN